MYRQRTKYSAKLREARDGRPEYPRRLPELRRVVIVIDYDTGTPVEHRIELYRTARIDCYRATADGRPCHDRVGWSRGLEMLRKAFPRTLSTRALG